MANWTFGTVSLIVTDYESDQEIYRAKLKVLDGTADVLQYFGAGSVHAMVKCLVIGDTALTQLRTWATSDTSKSLSDLTGVIGTYKIDGSIKASRMKYASALLNGVVYTTDVTNIYECEIDFVSTALP